MENYNKIKENCESWVKKNLDKDFKFRNFQLDCIVNIINNTLNTVKTQVCEAPTGTGKSIIALIAAGVLADYYNLSTYILCSDTALFNQYEEDIKRYNLNFGCVCGKDNYSCKRNGLPFSNSRCQMSKTSLKSLVIPSERKAGFRFSDCADQCKYVLAVRKGHKSKVTVLTYQLWLSAGKDEKEDFMYDPFWKKRDLVICDEAHKLPDIIQNHFSPRVAKTDMVGIKTMMKFAALNDLEVPEERHFDEVLRTMNAIMIQRYSSEALRSRDMLACLKRWATYVEDLSPAYNLLEEWLAKGNYKSGIDLTSYAKAGIRYNQDRIILKEYIDLIDKLGFMWSVPTKITETEFLFNCAKESEMVQSFFHERTDREFLMSATIGNIDNYRIMISSDKETSFKSFDIDNEFDFTKSPIYYNTKYKLSYREKDDNLPFVVEQITKICKEHKGVRGIIQTGSYEFGKYLWDNAPPDLRSRLVFYNNPKERKQAIQEFQDYYGKILIGPSLLEGLNFEDDLCRFIIVMKVPYASLADNLVKAKMNVYKTWYTNDVINKMIQGIGRGVRSKTDWCETYILDGCWNDVMTRYNMYLPEKFKSRMIAIQ